jgi:uncharacterized protein YndB with AHSA1/START domain
VTPGGSTGAAPALDLTITINAPAPLILRAFFDRDALGAWWQVKHAVTTPRLLGPYAVEWTPTDYRDDVLGRLGGVFRGTVMTVDAEHGFFVADAFWLPPDGDPIGPMALEVTCTPSKGTPDNGVASTDVRVVQTGFEEGARWRRYYDVIEVGWNRALNTLKMLLEK